MGDRSLVQGLKGDAHYLIVEQGCEQVHVPVPRQPVRRDGEGCARPGAAFARARAFRLQRGRQGRAHGLDGDGLPHEHTAVVESLSADPIA